MFRLLSSIIFLLFLVFFALFNRESVDIVFFPTYMIFSGPKFLWVFLSFAFGIMFSNVFYTGKFIKAFFRERKMKLKLVKLEKQTNEKE